MNQYNYMKSTKCSFKGCKMPKRNPDYVSESGSKYWYGFDKKGCFVIRKSNHWVDVRTITGTKIEKQCRKIATCVWYIKTTQNVTTKHLVGKAYFDKFIPL